eukprot:1201437-Pyramimonas_sp.AAC.1
MLKHSDALLNSALQRAGYAQNRSKQVLLFHAAGDGAVRCRRWLKKHVVTTLGGKLQEEARYLGPHVSLSATTGAEIDRRARAASS